MKATSCSISWEHQYLNLIDRVFFEGDDRADRTGTGTRALFGERLDIDLQAGFPAITTKKLAWKAVVSELLWMIEGSGDERRLAEILHGTRDPSKHTIWTANAANTSGAKYSPAFPGDLGRVYGVQWRHWRKYKLYTASYGVTVQSKLQHGEGYYEEVDQLSELIHKLRTNPTDRRMIISAWNVGELDLMALPPCHMLAQFFVRDNKLSCMMTQRSVDLFLGSPFNVASYALFTHLLAQVCNLGVGRLIISMGDCHLYRDHLDQVNEQLNREPYSPPVLELNPKITDIEKFTMDDIKLVNYVHHSAITAQMSA